MAFHLNAIVALQGLVRYSLVVVPCAVAVSALSYYAMERPFLRWKARLAPAPSR